MSRRLDDLSDRFRPLAVLFLARLVEAGIPVMVVDTLRTREEQVANLAKGVSWTLLSKHLTGDAIDVCPFEQFLNAGPDKLLWDGADPIWTRIGAIGEACGMKWGGRFRPPAKPDLGHFEYIAPPLEAPRA